MVHYPKLFLPQTPKGALNQLFHIQKSPLVELSAAFSRSVNEYLGALIEHMYLLKQIK